ncbi:MAG: sugar ABC transporter permease, partial [Spirochaetes bacterium]|nr:sugar ABC transporter permease [Spirochaetota bacterium]
MRSPRRTGVLAPITREWLFALLLLSPCLLFTCLFALYPIARSLHLSMHRMILSVPGSGTAFVGLQNFIDLAADPEAAEALWHTIIFVTVSTFLEVLLGLGIALVINRRFRGRGIVRASVLVPWAIPTAVASQLWRFIFSDQYGLLNLAIFGSDIGSYRAWLAEPSAAFTAVIAADVWKTSSFAALLILAGLQIIPDELYEAAA